MPSSYSHLSSLLVAWYEREKRELPWRETQNPYFVWLSEIILQQTRVQQGLDYYMRFIQRFPTVEALAAAEEDEVMLLWQGLGYYSRARNLHKAAKMVVEKGQLPFPATFEDVLALPGVGEYTAGAIMSFAYNAPYPAADGNVYRVLSRLFDCSEPFDTTAGKKLFRQFAWDLLDRDNARLHNSAIMEFGALYCTPLSPDCEHCPVAAYCKALASGTVDLLPVRKEKAPLKDRFLLYRVYLTSEKRTLLHQRVERDIWQHLYEFPIEEYASEQEMLSHCVSSHHFSVTHVLSHQKLHSVFEVQLVDSLPAIPGTFPVKWEQLQDFALSRLTLKFLESFD